MIMEKQESGPFQKVVSVKLVEDSCSWETNSDSPWQRITCPLLNMKVHYHVCKSLPLDRQQSTLI
jgi:hypothetical protein